MRFTVGKPWANKTIPKKCEMSAKPHTKALKNKGGSTRFEAHGTE